MTDFDFYNAADDLLQPNLAAGRGAKAAFIDRDGPLSYAELDRRVNRFANALRDRGIGMEARVLLCMLDTVDLPVCFLGAIRAGAVPVPVNTLLNAEDYRYMLADSRARVLVVSEALYRGFATHLGEHPLLEHVLVAGTEGHGHERLADALDGASEVARTAPTRRDDVAFWLYTSGTTGRPKGALHTQADLRATFDLYARPVLGVNADDLHFSAAKLFFAYGLGNGLTFPLAAGATAVLYDGRPTPEAVAQVLDAHRPTLFFGVPTLYAMMLNSGHLPARAGTRLRHCVSAGEALPQAIFEHWRERVGVDILDGIGSTEMLHIFLSNRPGAIRAGTSGKPVPGYELKLLDDAGAPVPEGEIGDLWVQGPSSAIGYWNRRARSAFTFQGPWTRTGDKYRRDADGFYVYCGRSDDMLKVGGIYVSPTEVEHALAAHAAVVEAAVIGAADADELVKPKAFVVLAANCQAGPAIERELIAFVRKRLAEYKRPRWIEFVDELPKTATGKIQRYKLRPG
ncbi:MAG: benzoate-CoA ligase family protein [Gammaproteobacteria bacterium]|nr:benzoate-CoA ligase family protein [Gammaproteobacteria bacterium]